MLSKLTAELQRETQIGLITLALLGVIAAIFFGGGSLGARATNAAASAIVFPVAFGMMWLVLMAQIWVRVAPKAFIRFVSNFFFIFSVLAGFLAVMIPFFAKDYDQPGSSALMAAGVLGFGLATFRVYKKHLSQSPDAA